MPGTDSSESSDGPDDQAIVDVLRSFDGSADDDAVAAFHTSLVKVAQRAPGRLAEIASGLSESDNEVTKAAAAYGLGRAAESVEDGLVPGIEQTLVRIAAEARERVLYEAAASALGHVWNRRKGDDFALQVGYLRAPSVGLRLAAAQHLALATPVPVPVALVRVLESARDDEDEAVRGWAEFGLSYTDGWPEE